MRACKPCEPLLHHKHDHANYLEGADKNMTWKQLKVAIEPAMIMFECTLCTARAFLKAAPEWFRPTTICPPSGSSQELRSCNHLGNLAKEPPVGIEPTTIMLCQLS